MSNPKETVTFHYQKAPDCRETVVTGAFGGVNPQTGQMHMALYAERPPIPVSVTHALGEDRALGDEILNMRESKRDFVRVVQTVVHMDINAALAMHAWLGRHIDIFKDANPGLFDGSDK